MRQASPALPARDGEPDQKGNGVGSQYADGKRPDQFHFGTLLRGGVDYQPEGRPALSGKTRAFAGGRGEAAICLRTSMRSAIWPQSGRRHATQSVDDDLRFGIEEAGRSRTTAGGIEARAAKAGAVVALVEARQRHPGLLSRVGTPRICACFAARQPGHRC
jgi:hypothetical protein